MYLMLILRIVYKHIQVKRKSKNQETLNLNEKCKLLFFENVLSTLVSEEMKLDFFLLSSLFTSRQQQKKRIKKWNKHEYMNVRKYGYINVIRRVLHFSFLSD